MMANLLHLKQKGSAMKLINEKPDEMSEVQTFFWIVCLVAGVDPEEGGVIVEQHLVTKKWERVDDLVSSWEDAINSGNFYARVMAMRSVAEAHFIKS
jgi:hypothetical protein